jgi:hypothetical protein
MSEGHRIACDTVVVLLFWPAVGDQAPPACPCCFKTAVRGMPSVTASLMHALINSQQVSTVTIAPSRRSIHVELSPISYISAHHRLPHPTVHVNRQMNVKTRFSWSLGRHSVHLTAARQAETTLLIFLVWWWT